MSGKGEQVRGRLVEAAVRLLADEGPAALQARRLAREIGTSTMAVYHYFGGMPQLLRAVSDDGFRRLTRRVEEVAATEDPVADLMVTALAYREFARGNPNLYDLMFGLAEPGGHRPEPQGAVSDDPESWQAAAYGCLVAVAERAIRTGRLNPAEPANVAAQLWSVLHGFVALELAGHFGPAHCEDPLARVFVPLGNSLLLGLGDTAGRLSASSDSAFGRAAPAQ